MILWVIGPLPKRAEVYERLAVGLKPAATAVGMRRVSRIYWPCWMTDAMPSGDLVFMSLQVDEKATDAYSGGGFRIEFEKSAAKRPASGLAGRAMFFQLLTDGELVRLLAQQNEVIRRLPKPPIVQIEAYPAGPVREVYLSWFREQKGFDAIRTWMRYRTLADVDEWVNVLGPLVASFVRRAEVYLTRGTVHLGRGSLVSSLP